MKPCGAFAATANFLGKFPKGCERGDSNPHGITHRNLNPARLPVPPLSRAAARYYTSRGLLVNGRGGVSSSVRWRQEGRRRRRRRRRAAGLGRFLSRRGGGRRLRRLFDNRRL